MKSFKAAYQNEIYKILKKKKLIVAGIISAALLAGIAGILYFINSIAGLGLMQKSTLPVLILPLFQYSVLPLFTAFIAIDMFSGEFANDTIKLVLTRPVSRVKIYFAKTLACQTFLGAMLLFTLLLSCLGVFIGGFSAETFLKTIGVYILAYVPLAVLSQMVIFVSNYARGTTSAFLISILLFLFLIGFGAFCPSVKSFSFVSGFDWYKYIVGDYSNFGKAVRQLLIFLGYAAFFLFGGMYRFENRSV